MLDEHSIAQALQDAVENILHGKLENAQAVLDRLDFEQLLQPVEDRTKGSCLRFRDPSIAFGTIRVYLTDHHVRMCREALRGSNCEIALRAAERALRRWEEKCDSLPGLRRKPKRRKTKKNGLVRGHS